MSKEFNIKQFIGVVQNLPPAEEQGQWIRWLSKYHTPGYYHRKIDKKRNARYVYNHLANPEMLLWLIQAAGVNKNLVRLAKSDSDKITNMNRASATIRRYVPWDVLGHALQEISEYAPTHWLQYWKPFQIKPAISEPWILYRSAGDQLRKVKPGDVVWIISVDPPGKLITLGPIHVERVLSHQEAKVLLGPKLWPAHWFIVNTGENVHRAKYVDLSSIASSLHFESKNFSELILKDDKVSGTQFQRMRKLTPESVELISRMWHTAKSREEKIADRFRNELDRLASLDEKRSVSVRREQRILRQILFNSASKHKCGICGRELPISLLVTAHIKPRAQCSDSERRDTSHNLMPLCLLGCDTLFEQGFIAVDRGRVIEGPKKTQTRDLKKSIQSVSGSPCKYWSVESKKYFKWRAKHPDQKRTNQS